MNIDKAPLSSGPAKRSGRRGTSVGGSVFGLWSLVINRDAWKRRDVDLQQLARRFALPSQSHVVERRRTYRMGCFAGFAWATNAKEGSGHLVLIDPRCAGLLHPHEAPRSKLRRRDMCSVRHENSRL